MTAATPVLPGEDPDAFRHRLDSWAEALAPADAVEQFLVEQAATASWKIERADRIEADRLFAALRTAEEDQCAGRRKEADRLGRLLLGLDGPAADPALAQEVVRILDPGSPVPVVDRRVPLRPIVARLESTAEGCAWLLERWSELRDPLEKGTDWDEDRSVEAVRLAGRQPLNLPPEHWENHRLARHLAPVERAEPSGDDELDEGRQMALEEAFSDRVEAEICRELAGQLVEDLPEDQAEARSALLGVVGRAIGRLTELSAAHEARWEAGALERAQQMTHDPDPEDELLWRYQFGCGRPMKRMLDTLLKVRREGRAAVRPDGRPEVRGAAPTAAPDEATAPADAPPSCSPERPTNASPTLLGVDTRPGPQPSKNPPSRGGKTRRRAPPSPPFQMRGSGRSPAGAQRKRQAPRTRPPPRPSRHRPRETKPTTRPRIIPARKSRPPPGPSRHRPRETKPAPHPEVPPASGRPGSSPPRPCSRPPDSTRTSGDPRTSPPGHHRSRPMSHAVLGPRFRVAARGDPA